ncbi:laminin subunit alpha-5-like isoform X2 [Carassius auratus]|uniref:Laminin subunit alpha-5-like isoform X2 n=1 Tax=Carassius auratus TaxID=7957 RepID=A0A6P6LNQ9_CARAU|nr:laminin subunit alpha-5-like isoform X2 [Carassius auratus]
MESLGVLFVLACVLGVVMSQTTLSPAVTITTVSVNMTTAAPSCSGLNTSTCAACAPGSYYDNETLLCSCCPEAGLCVLPGACLLCVQGFYQPLAGQQGCVPCSSGFYSNVTGSPVCQPCPSGSFSNNTGSASCAACAPGFYTSLQNSTSCNPCPQGTYCNSSSCAQCRVCPAGSEALRTASKECTPCRPGMHKLAHQTMCQICSSGFYQIHWGQENCDLCPENHYCPSPDVNPILCPTDAFCPEGSTAPGYCMETFFRKWVFSSSSFWFCGGEEIMTVSFPLPGPPSCEKTAHLLASMGSLVMLSLFMQAGDITMYKPHKFSLKVSI